MAGSHQWTAASRETSPLLLLVPVVLCALPECRALSALAATAGKDFTLLISCSALSLPFITIAAFTAAGVLHNATKLYLNKLSLQQDWRCRK